MEYGCAYILTSSFKTKRRAGRGVEAWDAERPAGRSHAAHGNEFPKRSVTPGTPPGIVLFNLK